MLNHLILLPFTLQTSEIDISWYQSLIPPPHLRDIIDFVNLIQTYINLR